MALDSVSSAPRVSQPTKSSSETSPKRESPQAKAESTEPAPQVEVKRPTGNELNREA